MGLAPRARWVKLAWTGASLAAYMVWFLLLDARIGPSSAAFMIVPIIVAAWMLGLRGGVAMAILTVPVNTVLLNLVTPHTTFAWDILATAGGGPGTLAGLVVGIGFGRMTELFQEVHERRGQQAALAELTRSALMGASVNDIMEEASRVCASVLDARFAGVVEVRPGTTGLLVTAASQSAEPPVGRAVPVGSLSDLVARTRKTVVVADYDHDPRFTPIPASGTNGARSGVAAPILSGDQVFGVFHAGGTAHRKFTPSEVEFVESVADVLAIALRRSNSDKLVHESEAHLRTLFDNLPLGVYRTTPDGRILFANPALLQMLGYDTVEGLAAQGIAKDRADGYDGEAFRVRIERDGEVRGIAAHWYRRDGASIAVRESARLVRNASGEIDYYEGTVEDVTQQREAEKALRESEDQFRHLWDATFEGVVMLENDRFVQVNKTLAVMFGYRVEEMIGLTPRDIIDASSQAEVQERLAHHRDDAYEVMARRKDGSRFPVRIAGRDFLRKGRTVRISAFRDITEEKRIEGALRAASDHARSLFEVSIDALATLDDAGVVTDVNRAMEIATGRPRSEISGTKFALHFVGSDDVAARIQDAIEHGISRDLLARMPTAGKDGDAAREWLVNVIRLERTGPGGATVLVSARDVTERLRLERDASAQRDAMARNERLSALGTLVAGVAHEINNPLTYLSGNLELALLDIKDIETALAKAGIHGGPDLAETTRGLETALAGAQRIGHITRALKAVARQPTSARDEGPLSVKTVIQDIAALFHTRASEGVKLVFAPCDEDLFVTANASELHQVLLNLVRNGIEAVIENGGGNVDVSARPAGMDHVEIIVSDDGRGISPEDLPKIFTPFFTTKTHGTGLGLSIVQSIVNAQGGEIRVGSQPGKGATFILTLPRARVSVRAPEDAPLNSSGILG